MADKVPNRFIRALGRLTIRPSESVLEIGCGHGVMATLVTEKLKSGTLTAIDRSPRMIAVASRRNADAIAAGKAELHVAELATLELGPKRFDKVFAIHVNVFWLQPERELAAVKRLLKPGGTLHLFYEPLNEAQASGLAAKLAERLEANGFDVVDPPSGRVEFVEVVAKVRRSGRRTP